MKPVFALLLAVCGLPLALEPRAEGSQDSAARRAAYLADMLRIFPKSSPWEEWLQRTRELPPDFDALPSIPYLPEALQFADGHPVKTKRDWARRRAELLELFRHYVIGREPPPPDNLRVGQEQTREEGGVVVRELVLEFGPQHGARLHVELIQPKGRGPFPVFLTQDNHRRWALVAVSRGYLACVYAGADSRDDTGDWVALYPDYDWTKLTRRAWAASRCIDYLWTLPVVDRQRIALTGHSRNGKLSLIAAALDERIAAVISSSSGAGGSCSYRLFSESQFGEGIELITRNFPDWLHPRLRFFAGRENKLPIDQHELIACIAPRPCLLSSALNDNVESVWALEQTRRAAGLVYAKLGALDALQLRYREGPHATDAEDLEAYVDWLDTQFGRARAFVPDAPLVPTYEDWLQASRERIDPRDHPERDLHGLLEGDHGQPLTTAADWERKRTKLRRRVAWGLGEAPPLAESPAGDYGAEGRHLAVMLGRDRVPSGLAKQSVNFGNYINGDLYYPADAETNNRRLPAMIWVHPISNADGYVPGYRRGDPPHLILARSGYAVFAFDQLGHGARLKEAQGFYRRYPHWSLLGKTVQDLRAVMDVLRRHPRIDPAQIYLLGYGTGAMAALHAAALDERVAAVIAVGGFTPMRLDTPDKGTGGIARWSRWLPLQPRLGPFVGHERRLPYDYHEVLALIAPRPALIITPRIDYQSTFADLKACIDEVRRVYALLGNAEGLVFQRTDDYHHFTPDLIFCLCGAETVK